MSVRCHYGQRTFSELPPDVFQNGAYATLTVTTDRHGATISRNVAESLDIAQHTPWDRIASPSSGAAQWITANSLLSPASP
jgi:hypothetical protein